MHLPVLLPQVLADLDPRPGEVLLDCTVGRGGHACAIAARLGPTGTVVAVDLDPENLAHAVGRLESTGPAVHALPGSFVEAPRRLRALGLRADLVLADLGFASNQMDDPARGFSIRADGPLDMRLDGGRDPARPTAADLVSSLTEAELADLIFRVGEDPFARRIARKIAEHRVREPISTTADLARLVVEAYGARARSSRMHPATRTFMALRIAVNDELGALDGLLGAIQDGAGLVDGGGWLNAGARIAIISFHSLEDRRVKRCFAELERRGLAERTHRKPVVAEDDEVATNPRARSAKLRTVRLRSAGNADRTP